jgi:serine/threonine-protein kinase
VAATHLDPDDRISTARELGDRVMEYLDGDRDLALRRQLAAGHLAKARAVFADESERTDERHRVAMREAAGALALDPTLAGAAELVGRLMLEPPRTTPREVDDAIRLDEVRNAKETARAGVWAVGGALAFTPLLWWIAPSGSPYVIGLTALLIAIGITCVYVNRSTIPRPGIVVISNTVLLVLVARMFSPVLIAPGVAAVLAMAMALTPRFSLLGSAYTITGLLSCAILGPLALERLGVWSQTMFVDAQGVLFHAPVFAGNETPTIIVGALYAVALVAGACLMANTMRARAKEAARHLHLQAWQLRQLVPASST